MNKQYFLIFLLFSFFVAAECGNHICEPTENYNTCDSDCNFLKIDGDKIVDQSGKQIHLKGFHTLQFYNPPYRSYHAGIREYIYDEHSVLVSIQDIVKNGIDVYIRNYSIPASYLSNVDQDLSELVMLYTFTDADLTVLNDTGANVVRIQVKLWHIEKVPYEYSDYMLQRLDFIINSLADAGIYSIIDLHSAGQNNLSHNAEYMDRMWNNEDELWDRSIEFWRLISNRYKDNPYVAAYDVLNEPWAPDRETLHDLYSNMIEAIRESDNNHIIFLEIDQANKDTNQMGGKYDDANYGGSFHYYQPYQVTSRLESYPGTYWHNYLRENVLWDYDTVYDEIERLKNLEDLRGLPVFVGEFGAIINDSNIESALAWDRDSMKAMNDLGIHFTYHPLKTDYALSRAYLIPKESNRDDMKKLQQDLIFKLDYRPVDLTEEDRLMIHTDNYITPPGLREAIAEGFSVCGNWICNERENCSICPEDCGTCQVCGDDECTGNETYATCPDDCFHPADVDEDGCVDMDELIQHVQCWRITLDAQAAFCTISTVVDAIDIWLEC